MAQPQEATGTCSRCHKYAIEARGLCGNCLIPHRAKEAKQRPEGEPLFVISKLQARVTALTDELADTKLEVQRYKDLHELAKAELESHLPAPEPTQEDQGEAGAVVFPDPADETQE